MPSAACSRRAFLGRAAGALGALSLAPFAGRLWAGDRDLAPGAALTALHHPARAKRVIFLMMSGGPSHLDLFDHKPKLIEMAGKSIPDSFVKGEQSAQLKGNFKAKLLPSVAKFSQRGQSGQWISDLLPHTARIADDLCIVRSMHTDAINHDPAHAFLNTGSTIPGRPAWGAWTWYGLGSDNADLPGFVVMISDKGGQLQPVSSRIWHSGFLPSRFQGVVFGSGAAPVHYLAPPPGVDAARQADVIAAAAALNRLNGGDDAEAATRTSQYQLAERMQRSVPELADLSGEPASVRALYGLDQDAGGKRTGGFARNCLLARRLIERGVRFVQVIHRDWDHHGSIAKDIPVTAAACDQASAALVTDLKQRGLLDDTIVVWGGEFGRTPMAQGTGRDHHIRGYTMWLAGGGFKPGTAWGGTDEFGFHAVQDRVHVHDLHATVLHQLGIDHRRLSWFHQGRDFRLTDVHGHVIKGLLA